jgi:hypothetical protein
MAMKLTKGDTKQKLRDTYLTPCSDIISMEAVTTFLDSWESGMRKVDPMDTTTVGNWQFNSNECPPQVSLPNAVIVESYAFMNCVNLESVELPKVEVIGSNAFTGCEKLSAIAGLESVTSIGGEAFNGCCLLSSIALPEVSVLGRNLFVGCKALVSISLGGGSAWKSFGRVSKDVFGGFLAKSDCTLFLPENQKVIDKKWYVNDVVIDVSAFKEVLVGGIRVL